MNPFDIVEEERYPKLHVFLKTSFNMLISDIRGLLRLPYAQLKAGCNLTLASQLFSLIGGISVCLYNASYDDFLQRSGRGIRFKGVLKQHYPWDDEQLNKEQAVIVLYDSTRNPIEHCLGLYKPEETNRSRIVKNRLTPQQIEEIESSESRPHWLPPTITLSPSGFFRYDINTVSLYWGVFRLIDKLLKDGEQLEKSERFQINLWDDYNIKGLKSTIETMVHMKDYSQEYQMLKEGVKQQLCGLKERENILLPRQKQEIQDLTKALGI